jgi:hypothetical protein
MNKDIVEGSNIEQPSFGGGPTKLIFTSLSYFKGVQLIEKRSKDIHLLIMSHSNKSLCSTNGSLCYGSIFHASITRSIQKSFLNSLMLTP